MNFNDCVRRFIINFQNDDRDIIYYIAKGYILLYVNDKEVKWTRLFLKSSVRKKSTYIFDMYLTIDYDEISETYEIRAGRIIRQNYFSLGSIKGIPIKYKKDEYGDIRGIITSLEEK